MDRVALNNKIYTLTQKVEENRKPFSLIMIGGIVLATLSFFLLLFLIIRLLLGIGDHIISAIKPSFQANNASGRASLMAPQFKTSTSGGGHLRAAQTHPVYARPIGSTRISPTSSDLQNDDPSFDENSNNF